MVALSQPTSNAAAYPIARCRPARAAHVCLVQHDAPADERSPHELPAEAVRYITVPAAHFAVVETRYVTPPPPPPPTHPPPFRAHTHARAHAPPRNASGFCRGMRSWLLARQRSSCSRSCACASHPFHPVARARCSGTQGCNAGVGFSEGSDECREIGARSRSRRRSGSRRTALPRPPPPTPQPPHPTRR